MNVLVAASSSIEGHAALAAGAAEARRRGVALLWANLGADDVPDVASTVGDIETREIRLDPRMDKVDAFVDAVVAENVSLVVVGLRRRNPVGKLLLGSMAQRVLLDVEVPVLAVKAT
jgi:nucleotide-binding universal stress UspA family protein